MTDVAGVEISGTNVQNHLRKWRARWVKICKLQESNCVLWDANTNIIIVEDDLYNAYIMDHPHDVEYVSVPTANFNWMAIF